MKPLLTIGLTGGIATGKSTLAALWRQRGAAVIDADELGHRALEPHTDSYRAIVQAFGAPILNADHTINRAALGAIVFNDEQQRQTLNRIVHPVVADLRAEALRALEQDDHTTVAVNTVPLLYEAGLDRVFDCVVTIACSPATQAARLAAKGFTAVQIAARLRAQWPHQKKMDRANFVIWNDGTLRTLADQAAIIWATIKETNHAATKKHET